MASLRWTVFLISTVLLINDVVAVRDFKFLEGINSSITRVSRSISSEEEDCTILPRKQQSSSNPKKETLEELLDRGTDSLILGNSDDVVLVLGNTGSGKSTILQIMAGNLSRLHAVLTHPSDGNNMVIVDDDNRIGIPSFRSKTLIPDLIMDSNTSTIFYDFPGFSDNRGHATDVAANFFMKKVTDNVKRVKMLFVVVGTSLKLGYDRLDFDRMATHVVTFVKDINKFKDGIALIATKVESYERNRYRSHKSIVNGIAGFLNGYIVTLKNELQSDELPDAKKDILEKKIQFAQAFLSKKDGNYYKIGVSRSPVDCGVLGDMSLVLETKGRMISLHENLTYVKKTDEDFGYTLRADTVVELVNFTDSINIEIQQEVKKTMIYFQKNFEFRIVKQSFTEKVKSLETLSTGISQLVTKIQNEQSPATLATEITATLKSLGYKTPLNFNKKLKNKWEIMEFFDKVAEKNFNRATTNWLVPIRELNRLIENQKDWNRFVTTFEEKVELFEFQKGIKDKPLNFADNEAALKYINESLNFDSKIWELANENPGVLSNILNFAVKPFIFTCLNGEFILKGNFVKFTSFIKNGWIVPCPGAKIVTIFASKKLFIDTELNGLGKSLKVFIFSPVWEIIGDGKINLDGSNAGNIWPAKASNGFSKSSAGIPGLPGKPGGNGGALYGLFLTIADSGKLRITANGGNGGDGQAGGDGQEGFDGHDAKYENFPSCYRKHVIEDVNGDLGFEGSFFYSYIWKKMYGSQGSAGGNGGHGGARGLAGLAGTVEIDSPFKKLDINIHLAKGSLGSYGMGGMGANGGRNGRQMHCKWWLSTVIATCGWRECGHRDSEKGKFAGLGSGGESGANHQGIIYPNSKMQIGLPEKLKKLGSFKEFLLTSLDPRLALEVFNSIQGIGTLKTEYKTVDLAKDVLNLINQFHLSRDRESFTPFFKKMLEIIREYSTNKKENKFEQKLIWNYLYSSILSKLDGVKVSLGSSVVTDTFGYFDSIVGKMRTLKGLKTIGVINEVEQTYKGKYNQKINDTLDYISNQVIPGIDNFENEIDTSIYSLLEELAKYHKDARDSLQEAKDAKIQLKNSLFKRTIFSVLKCVGRAIGFLGQAGDSIGSVLESGSFLSESLVIGQRVKPKKAALPPASVQEYAKKLSNFAKNNENLEIKKFQAKISELSKLIFVNKDSVLENQVKESQKILDDYKSGEICPTVILEERRKFHKTVQTQSNPKIIAAVDTLQKTFRTIDVAYDIYDKHKDDNLQLEELVDIVAQSEKNVEDYEKFTESIYDIFIPFAKSITSDLSTTGKNLHGLSSLKLKIGSWDLKQNIKNIQLKVAEFTQGFQAAEEFSIILQNLEESLNLLVDLFSSVESYEEKKEFAEYIGNVNSASANPISIRDTEIKNIISKLELSLKSDLFMSDYTNGMRAFKQFVFPFANLYLDEYKQVVNFPALKNSQDVGQITDFYTGKMLSIKDKLDRYKTSTLPNQDENVIQTNYTSYLRSSQPFYTWGRQHWGQSIADLLSGKKVEFKADVRKTVGGQQAVKFKVAEIHFKSSVPSLQTELDDKLKDFKVEMKHMGTSYFKFDSEYFVMRGEPQKFQWNFEYTGNRRAGTNGIYEKFEKGDFLMSPYALWEVQLKPAKSGENARFEELARFADYVNLELVGIGNYVREEFKLTGLNLREYYEVDESIQD